MGARGRLAAIHAHLPGRAMADGRVLLVAGDVVRAHAGEEIVGVVVLAHVVEAEAPVFVFALPSLGRAVGRGRRTARPLAAGRAGPQAAVLVGLDPYAVEERRVDRHDLLLCGWGAETFKS